MQKLFVRAQAIRGLMEQFVMFALQAILGTKRIISLSSTVHQYSLVLSIYVTGLLPVQYR